MAEATITELFEQAGTDTISHRGRIVKSIVRIPVGDGAVVTVERRQVGADRPQALKLGLDKGVFDVNGHREPVVALWSDTSPDKVTLTVRGEARTLEIWNAWSLGGVDSSWIGNAGMVTRNTDGGQLLQCSDGVGPAGYTDLVALVTVER
jgi:hypothetical protein